MNNNSNNDNFLNSLTIDKIVEYINLFEKLEQLYPNDIKIFKKKSINILNQQIENSIDNWLFRYSSLELKKLNINNSNNYMVSDITTHVEDLFDIVCYNNYTSSNSIIRLLLKKIINIFDFIIEHLIDNEFQLYDIKTYIAISNDFILVEKYIHNKLNDYDKSFVFSITLNKINSLINLFNEKNNNKITKKVILDMKLFIKMFTYDTIIDTLKNYFNNFKIWFMNKKLFNNLVVKIYNNIIEQNLLNVTDEKKLRQFIQNVIDDIVN